MDTEDDYYINISIFSEQVKDKRRNSFSEKEYDDLVVVLTKAIHGEVEKDLFPEQRKVEYLFSMAETYIELHRHEQGMQNPLKPTKRTKEDFILPTLQKSNRKREYDFYSEILKAKVIYEHLINNETHSWLDINVLGVKEGNSNRRNSANILYYLGMRADYRGVFQGKELSTVIQVLTDKGQDYSEVVRLLKLLDNTELEKNINSDLEAELAEEGFGIEGHLRYYYGKRFERNPKNRKLAIQHHGLDCFVCGFNFEEVYGERGKDFIEVHHVKPLSMLEKAVEVNPETDLVPLCANCHRIIHRRKDDVLNLESLKNMISKEKRLRENFDITTYSKTL